MPLHQRNTLEARQFVTKTVEQGADASASVNTGAASTGGASSNSGNKGFPVAVAIPALIGGMAIAILGALGWWWYSRKKSRERRVCLLLLLMAKCGSPEAEGEGKGREGQQSRRRRFMD
jgi:hypothetical protein